MHSHRTAAKSAATDKLRRMTAPKGSLKGDASGIPADPADYNEGRFGSDGDMDVSAKTGPSQPKPRAYKRGGRVEGDTGKKRLDRPGRASGGRVAGKGKTTVNIIVGSGDKPPQPVPVPVPAPGAGGPPPMPPRPPMPMPAGLPPGGPPMAGPPMPPPGMPMRKRGGRVEQLTNATGGGHSGKGRLAKIAIQKRADKEFP